MTSPVHSSVSERHSSVLSASAFAREPVPGTRQTNRRFCNIWSTNPPLFLPCAFAGKEAAEQGRSHLILAAAASQKRGNAVLRRVPLKPLQVENREPQDNRHTLPCSQAREDLREHGRWKKAAAVFDARSGPAPSVRSDGVTGTRPTLPLLAQSSRRCPKVPQHLTARTGCTTAAGRCAAPWNAMFPRIPTPPLFPHHRDYGSYVRSVGTFIRRAGQRWGGLRIPLKPRDWSAVGGQHERRNAQVNFTDY